MKPTEIIVNHGNQTWKFNLYPTEQEILESIADTRGENIGSTIYRLLDTAIDDYRKGFDLYKEFEE